MSQRFKLLLVILALAAATQFMWLSYPRQVVFDEVHFGKFVTAYCCTGERFFDIHPPHAKLLVAGAAKLAGYEGDLSFSNIGQRYGAVSPIGLRAVPALMGMLLPLVIFILLRQLGAGQAAAFLGSMMVIFDNALTVQNRVISLDGVLLVAVFGCLSAYLGMEKSFRKSPFHWQRWAWRACAAGALAGLAVGAKFTGLVAAGVLAVILAWRVLNVSSYKMLARYLAVALLIAASGLTVYGAGWALHFALLTQSGPGDAWRVPQWDEGWLPVTFVKETIELHRIMFDANYNLEATHPDASRWWSWPYVGTPVFYWTQSGGEGRVASIYFLGNLVVWWSIGALLIISLLGMCYSFLYRRSKQIRDFFAAYKLESLKRLGSDGYNKAVFIPLAGYIISYVPLARVPRALFLYHYLTPLLFALLAGLLWLDGTGFFRKGSLMKQPPYYYVLLGAAAAMFLVFSPLTYGFFLPHDLYEKLFWFSTWR